MSERQPTHVEKDVLRRMPLSAPLWLWVTYLALVVALAFLARGGGGGGFIAVLMCAAFSFQFWTFAAWRGRVVPPTTDRGAPDA